jgi:voltage-gated potassium channel
MGRLIWITALVVVLYYLVPLEEGIPAWLRWTRVVAFAAGLAVVAWSVVREARRQAAAEPGSLPATGLVVVTVVGVTMFALADYGVAAWGEGEFVGLETRTDALYFAVSTLVTVGLGDVHPQGQLARGLVLGQMVFNTVVIATAATLLTRRVRDRTAGRGRLR